MFHCLRKMFANGFGTFCYVPNTNPPCFYSILTGSPNVVVLSVFSLLYKTLLPGLVVSFKQTSRLLGPNLLA